MKKYKIILSAFLFFISSIILPSHLIAIQIPETSSYPYFNLFPMNPMITPDISSPWAVSPFYSLNLLGSSNFSASPYSPFNLGMGLFNPYLPQINPLFNPSQVFKTRPSLSNYYGYQGYYGYTGLGSIPFNMNMLSGFPSINTWGIPFQYGFFPFGGFMGQGITPQLSPPVSETPQLNIEPINLSNVQSDNRRFLKNYSLSELNIPLKVPEYNMPLKSDDISNFTDFSSKISLSQSALDLLENNGFVVIKNPFNPNEEYITRPYKLLKNIEVPIFITTDSLLHLYHIQFDETLRQIEEREFFDKIWDISKTLLDDSIAKYENTTGDLKEASKRNVAYFTVGLSLLQPREDQLCNLGWECNDPGLASAFFTQEDLSKYHFAIPDFVKSIVNPELELIENHAGFTGSPIFIYKEDYSQYLPRGHYTRSEKLKNYFKAMMWYGRISMLLKGTDDIPIGTTNSFHPDALISTYDAMIQTMQACLIASRFAENQDVKNKWDRIYSVTAFYVGVSDDLGPYEFLEAMDFVFEGELILNHLSEENIEKIKVKLAEYMSPKIFGGTGNCGVLPPFTPEQADQCLEKTKGFRWMGQRFIPDSYMFSNLVGAYTDIYMGDKDWLDVFTCVVSGAGRLIRGFPRGLDVMALLDSERAMETLDELDDDKYKNYSIQFKKLEDEFSAFNEAEWNKNLYWAWLFALKPLLKTFGQGYPTFMQTKAWQDKELTTALASWAELRHDTILYAKQSYTMVETSLPPPEKPAVGYIEPVPEFFNRLLALTRMTTNGLDEMAVLDSLAKSRLQSLEIILERLVDLAGKELMNQELTQEDYDFIKDFGNVLNDVIEEVDEKAKKTTIVADVHTDGNTGNVLEEGVGYVKLMIVAYKVPDGRILVGAGPVMSYYEFKHPMNDRLTDEKWRDILESGPPEEPEWICNFAE